MKILLVDDNRDAAELLQMILEEQGYVVRTHFDGLGVLETALDFQPDVGILDIGLPGMSGYDVAQIIRNEPRLGNLALVALTGFGQPSDKSRARNAGFDAHMVKPVDIEELSSVIRGLTEQSSSPKLDGAGYL